MSSLMVVVLFPGGVQLITARRAPGEYVGRTFNEVEQRPLYLVNKHLRSDRAAGRRLLPGWSGGGGVGGRCHLW